MTTAVQSIRDRWPGLPDAGAAIVWNEIADDWHDDERHAANLLAASLELSGDESACAGRPDSMVAVARAGEMWIGCVWRGRSDATFAIGRGRL